RTFFARSKAISALIAGSGAEKPKAIRLAERIELVASVPDATLARIEHRLPDLTTVLIVHTRIVGYIGEPAPALYRWSYCSECCRPLEFALRTAPAVYADGALEGDGESEMKGVILAGGFDTRLSAETISRPKPMVEIGDRPILWHIMNIYAMHGVTEFVIALGYRGELIKDYFLNFGTSN